MSLYTHLLSLTCFIHSGWIVLVLQGLNFSTELWVLHIILLIPVGECAYIKLPEKSQVAWPSLGQATLKMKSCEGCGYRTTRRGQNRGGIQKNTLKGGVFRSVLSWLISRPMEAVSITLVLTRASGRPQRRGGEKLNLWPSCNLQLPLPVHCTNQTRSSRSLLKLQLKSSLALLRICATGGCALSAKFRKLGCHVHDSLSGRSIGYKKEYFSKKCIEYCTLMSFQTFTSFFFIYGKHKIHF